MKERPILFSAPMVRAILEGRKTQTRRIVKAQPKDTGHGATFSFDRGSSTQYYWIPNDISIRDTSRLALEQCPYGKPGDRLWVRETWTGAWHGTDGPENMHIAYAADGGERFVVAPKDYVLPKAAAKCGGWVSPWFIKRFASRILLEITDVRVQRLQEISEEDAQSEGVERFCTKGTPVEMAMYAESHPDGYRTNFRLIWDSINGKGAWSANPWVWAITFKRIEAAERAA